METVGRKGTSYSEISVSSEGVVARKGSTLTSLELIDKEVVYGADLNQDGVIGPVPDVLAVIYGAAPPPPPASQPAPVSSTRSTDLNSVYHAGSIEYSDAYSPFDRSLDVYGIKLLAWPAVGGSQAVSDTFLEKTAHTVTLLLDPDSPGIELEAQSAMISGLQSGSSSGVLTGQRIGYIGPDNYSPSIVNDSAGRNYPGLDGLTETIQFTDYVWELDDKVADFSVDGAVTETLEHLLHTISQHGFPVVYPNQLNNSTPEGPLWDAMQEAITNGVFNDDQYKLMDDGSNYYDTLVMREYVYLLTYAEWDYITEFVDGGTLAPEWSDNSRTPEQVAINNPLGHALYTNYISKIISKPDESVLKEIFSPNAPSGYVSSDQLGYDSYFSNDTLSSTDYL
ncbi:MAG: hypothetical protein CML40_07105 [Rhodobacteraceae bacterium]|nr:MAG: hypothetical protein CML40_07105 [Paracoccaceae bacterium]